MISIRLFSIIIIWFITLFTCIPLLIITWFNNRMLYLIFLFRLILNVRFRIIHGVLLKFVFRILHLILNLILFLFRLLFRNLLAILMIIIYFINIQLVLRSFVFLRLLNIFLIKLDIILLSLVISLIPKFILLIMILIILILSYYWPIFLCFSCYCIKMSLFG